MLVGLGRFGIIYSVILETVPAFSLARERAILPTPMVMNLLRQGIAGNTFLDPLVAALPPPSAALNAESVPPRAMELLIDTRNPVLVYVVRRWRASGPDLNMQFGTNPLCDAGAGTIIGAAAAALAVVGMDPTALETPLLLADPSRPVRLNIKQIELLAELARPLTPGQALARAINAYWEFGISRIPDLLALIVYQQQFGTQRGPSYAVMTGNPADNTSTCFRVNSCEIMFDAADARLVGFVELLAISAPRFRQAGYISMRFSRRSRALLSMHGVQSDHAVSVEVSTLKELSGSQQWIDFVLSNGIAFGGRPHWGQQHRPVDFRNLYGEKLDRWRAVLGGLSGASGLFSNGFTLARQLEPQGARPLKIEGLASQLAEGEKVVSQTTPALVALLLDERAPAPPEPRRRRADPTQPVMLLLT